MRERPILFNTEMVLAILEGRKTETRRVMKPQLYPIPESLGGGHGWEDKGVIRDDRIDYALEPKWLRKYCPYGIPGDRLWVRETCERYFMLDILFGEPTKHEGVRYVADGEAVVAEHGFDLCPWFKTKTLPSIHMPRWASRITLEITDIRVERVQDITEAGAVAEGVEERMETRRNTFFRLWDSINAKRGYSSGRNPWVWVIQFKAVAG